MPSCVVLYQRAIRACLPRKAVVRVALTCLLLSWKSKDIFAVPKGRHQQEAQPKQHLRAQQTLPQQQKIKGLFIFVSSFPHTLFLYCPAHTKNDTQQDGNSTYGIR